jgi:hypothetical protein
MLNPTACAAKKGVKTMDSVPEGKNRNNLKSESLAFAHALFSGR